ncbi:MAG: hypothetical protein ACRYFX_01580 [Janthinobacterium lividum]
MATTDSLFPAQLYFQAGQAVLRNAYHRDRFTGNEDITAHTLALVQRTDDNSYLPPVHWRYAPAHPADSAYLNGRWRTDSLRLWVRRQPRLTP